MNVLINSGGGSVFSASEIYTALKSFSGEVIVQIVGVAASAASVIAMAGSHVEMSPTAQLMIHNASVSVHGDYREMDHTSEFLKNINKSIMNAYTTKTGLNVAKLKSMMDKTTWMNAQQALELRFIDSVMFENEQSATASINIPRLVNGVLPSEVIEKMRNQLPHKRTFNASNTTVRDSNSNMLKDKPVINSLPKNNSPSYSREEGEYAINVMKTTKNLNEKGINTNDLTTNEVLEVQGLIEAFVTKS